jgi:hypothetical protein
MMPWMPFGPCGVEAVGGYMWRTRLVSRLPKHANAVDIKDFRPISMIHIVAKLVAKLLYLRLDQPPNGRACGASRVLHPPHSLHAEASGFGSYGLGL